MRISFRRQKARRRNMRLPVFILFLLMFAMFAACRTPQLPQSVWEIQLERAARARIAETTAAYLGEAPVLAEERTVTLDTYQLTNLQAELTAALQNALSGRRVCWVPSGSLTRVPLLNGRGPKIPVTLSVESAVQVRFESQLRGAGINRTGYSVQMVITARVCSVSLRFPAEVQVEAVFPVCESVSDGEIPQFGALLR